MMTGRDSESSLSPHAILPTTAETIAHTLKLPYIEIVAQPTNADHTISSKLQVADRAQALVKAREAGIN